MHAAFAKTNSLGVRFFWNLDAAVGLHAPNRFEDVLFVQWCLYKCSLWHGIDTITPPEFQKGSFRQALSKTNINGRCSGMKDDQLVQKIETIQALFLSKQDGRVDPMHNSAIYSHLGVKHKVLIIWFNIILCELYPTQFPRIDLVPEFAFQLGPVVRDVFWQAK